MIENKQLLLRKRPIGLPDADTWELVHTAIPALQDGEMLIKVHYISLDPAMRGWLNEVKSYLPPVGLGEVMRAGGVGEVLESKNDLFQAGDFVQGSTGVQTHLVSAPNGWYKIDPRLAPLPLYLSALGMTGMTAYFGLLDIGQPKAGETVVVSAAAGAVGSIVGQIAKIKGCRVIGIAGGAEKCQQLVDKWGFDGAIDYKNEEVKTRLKALCPDGIDVYFDNVGGDILDMVLTRIRRNARIVICGAISQYNNTSAAKGPSNYLSLLVNRARMEGFVVFDYAARYREAALEMGQWILEGKLQSTEHIEAGIEQFYPAFLKLFKGENRGKLMLKV